MNLKKLTSGFNNLTESVSKIAEKTTQVASEVESKVANKKISELAGNVSKISKKVSDTVNDSVGKKDDNNAESKEVDVEDGVTEAEIEEKGSKMLQVMDWAFEKSNGNIPGLGTSAEMAQKYLDKYGSVNVAIDKLIGWQIAAAGSAGFVTSLGGFSTMAVTLPANIASTMAIQLRMIGAIAELGGYNEDTEEKKTGMYLCLLGSQGGSVLSKTTSQIGVKFATAALKKLPGKVLTKINQRVGFRLLTKFGEKGAINLCKAIPVLGGVIGGAVDSFSTYAIAKAAKAMFLKDALESERLEQLDIEKMRLLINLARIDNDYADDEIAFLKIIANGMNLSPRAKKIVLYDIEHPKNFEVDMTPFKDDLMLSSSTLTGLNSVARIGGISSVEQLYMNKVAVSMGLSKDDVRLLLSNQQQ